MRRIIVVSALSTAVVLGTSAAASAAMVEVGHWQLDEVGETIAGDSSGSANHATNYNVRGDGQAYSFNGTNSRVVVRDSPSLDPGAADFSYSVQLSMTAPPASGETYDVLRKGLAGTLGGNYKLEVKNSSGKAAARCVIRDSSRVSAGIQSAGVNLADGALHRVTCTKSGASVTVKVDTLAPRTKTVAGLGPVSNGSDLALGAKAESSADSGFDWYQGKIADAWVAVNR